MAVHHVDVTLGAAATPIIAASVSVPSINCQWLMLESVTGNADVKIGGSTVSASSYGAILEDGPTARITMIAPQGLAINLSSTYLIGTQSQVVHCLYIT